MTFRRGDLNPRFSVIFSPMIWIFMWSEEPEIKSKPASKRDRTLQCTYVNYHLTSTFIFQLNFIWHPVQQNIYLSQMFRQYSYPYTNCLSIIMCTYYNLIRYLECVVCFDKSLTNIGISFLIAKRSSRVSRFFSKEVPSILN